MADEDLFIDSEKLKKMIALGIYDEEMADKVKNVKNKDLKGIDKSMIRPSDSRPPPPHQSDRQQTHSRGGRGSRGQRFMPYRGRGGGDYNRSGFIDRRYGVLSNSSVNWKEVVPEEEWEQSDMSAQKRGRSPSPTRDGFREGIRDGIQTKIQRNELERKLNIDYINDRNAGKSSNDTDLRPKSDTDSRIRDTDLRPATNRNSAHNLPNITSTATDGDYRLRNTGDGRPFDVRGYKKDREIEEVNRRFFPQRADGNSGPSGLDKGFINDIDDFIAKANNKLNIKPEDIPELANSRMGRTQTAPKTDNFNRDIQTFRSNDPLGLNQSDEEFNRRQPQTPINLDEPFHMSPDVVEVEKEEQNPSKHIAILKETVEELAKSNLYCQYCDCYLSSLVEVNTHIGTDNHQKNMTKKVMEENNNSNSQPNSTNSSVGQNRPISQTIFERVPEGMAAIVQMIEQKKPITLKTLTEMDNYEIKSDSEAALAKELAKLLTNELLNYKMNLMPDTVKEALKHQGIGLLNSLTN